MDFWKNNTIWVREIPQDNFISIDYQRKKSDMSAFKDRQYVLLMDYKCKNNDLEELPSNNNIHYLELIRSNIRSFRGIENIKGIKRLEVFYCLKLETDSGLSALSESIEWLHINQSKKFRFSDELLSLKNLKVLCLNDCGAIDNLEFLNNFPDLVDFRFVNTPVSDGNLTPILNHPKIMNAGFLNKRHYNYKSDELNDLLKEKHTTKEIPVYLGECKTFRYDIFDKG